MSAALDSSGAGTGPVIAARGLSREFRVYESLPGVMGALRNLFSSAHTTVHAVDGVSFEIARGEMVGFLGPNGAGKSTVIKMLTGVLVPTAGTATVCGIVPWQARKQNAQAIGVVFGQRTQLWWDLPPRDAFGLLGRMYRVEPDALRERLGYFSELLELTPFLGTPVRKLSLGQRMRCELTAALLHDPKVLFLDEPTIGLDVVAKDQVRRFLEKLNRERGVTVLLTTHDLSDVEHLCSRVMVIDRGKLLLDGPLESLRRMFGDTRTIRMELATDAEPRLPVGVVLAERSGRRLTLTLDVRCHKLAPVLAALCSENDVAELSVGETPIEDVVKRLYRDGTRHGSAG